MFCSLHVCSERRQDKNGTGFAININEKRRKMSRNRLATIQREAHRKDFFQARRDPESRPNTL